MVLQWSGGSPSRLMFLRAEVTTSAQEPMILDGTFAAEVS